MELHLATLCERGEFEGEHLSVVGSGKAVRSTSTFPFSIDLSLAIVVELDALDGPGPHDVRIDLADADERALGEVRTTITSRALAVEEVARVAAVVPLAPLEVPTPGRYVLRVSVDDRELRRVGVRIARAWSPASRSASVGTGREPGSRAEVMSGDR